MEERKILDKIWDDIAKFGWTKVKPLKRDYLALYGIENTPLAELAENQDEILCSACGLPPLRNTDPVITYGCGECGLQFGDRLTLYQHYDSEHKGKTSL